MSVQKYVRVNGVPRRASDLVGQVMAVMFSADDLQLVYGSPAVRRRYLDILISQLDRRYLRALQRYQRVMAQRNHLLRMIRSGGSRMDELDYWNDELVSEGRYLMSERGRTVRELSRQAGPIHSELTGQGESLELVYRPSVSSDTDDSLEALGEKLHAALHEQRAREIAQGVTLSGPHRDDLQLLIDGVDVGIYASRGQSRTATLAMRLAEAQHLADRRGQRPILLLDDVLSELDAARRNHVLDRVSDYEQCFITTTGADPIEERFLSQMRRVSVRSGRVEEEGEPGAIDDPVLEESRNNEQNAADDTV
jgi:DNA replication and repair protein RecF